ncbi:MAG: hypothetical protein IPL08_16655 [Saprospiraceae bacterium]|nr:hypothetical protein [Saprospiraceae bacterium]
MVAKEKVKSVTHTDGGYAVTYWDSEVLTLTKNTLIVNVLSIRFARRSLLDFMMINNLKGHTNGHLLFFSSDDPMYFITDPLVDILCAEGLIFDDDYIIYWKKEINHQVLNNETEDYDDLISKLNLSNVSFYKTTWIQISSESDGSCYISYIRPRLYHCLTKLLDHPKWNRTTFKHYKSTFDFRLPHMILETVDPNEFLRIEKRRIPLFICTQYSTSPSFDSVYPAEMESRIIALMIRMVGPGITIGISIEKISSNYKRETLAFFPNSCIKL